jgi:PmbA protein
VGRGSDRDVDERSLRRPFLVPVRSSGQAGVCPAGAHSRAAVSEKGVENGAIQYPVEEITIAGNLKDMFRGLAAVGNDVDPSGNIRTGSILIESMTLAGS